MESISSSASSIAAQIQHARAASLTQARLMMHQRELSSSPSPRLARSNSVRSTKSEKLYGSGRESYHASQPTSPTPPGAARLPISPLNTVRGTPYYSTVIPRTSKDDECHGSSLSLVSSSSSLYSSQEEKQAAEIRKLRKDLSEAQDKVGTLTNQLTTNYDPFQAHMVAAFEQSLTNMTNRLQKLTASSEQKDSEVSELRRTIDALRQQSVDAGLTVACLQSTSPDCHHHHHHHHHLHSTPSPTRHHLPQHPPNIASCSVLNVTSGSRSNSPEKTCHDVARRHTFTGNCKDLVVCEFTEAGGKLVRGTSVESVSSISSACSAASHTSNHDKSDGSKSGKKKGWLRSSFSKAFSRNHKKSKGMSGGSVSDIEGMERGDSSAPSSPQLQRANGDSMDGDCESTSSLCKEMRKEEDVEILKCQLQEKDMVLTDIRLEALTSAHQLESLKETLSKMRSEMVCLKQDNDRLHRIVTSKSLNSSQSSLPVSDSIEQRLSMGEEMALPDSTDVILIDPSDKDGKRVSITVYMGCHGDIDKYENPMDGLMGGECVIGAISVSGKTKWDMLDSLAKRIFKEYILRVDPVSNLGLSADSILSYHIGEISRGRHPESPELLPYGYLVGEVMAIKLILKGANINHVDALAFETMIPKSIVQRYVSLLTEHRRIILCGPSGTGKTYLAQKLAEYLVTRMEKDPTPGYIATFNVDHKTGKDLGAYLSHISEQCETNSADLPLVIILDNLHHAGALTDVFNGFLSAKYTQCPYIIGTMNQTTSCSTTNLQLHHNFRWVLMANHMEPVKGLVGRVARRRLTQVEVEAGPRLFLSCPGSLEGSQVWFTDLWNYSLVPYLVEAVREGLQLYGKRATWEDPTSWISETYPWPPSSHAGPQALLSLRPEDVGYDTLAPTVSSATQDKFKNDTQGENDPLLSMLMRLQEAANYSSPQQDSDTASLDNMENPLESTI
ncbi:Neuron navigator 2 [Chionoecetes opilio]|uniref:Neuron navigator 2 n=1 Tax=Chionoecetes opilio TaxID=41210 RepID=A0A8J4XLJ4_CHIOP|nr:Neuron navigator 2 [Chionoecetes opilio]